MSLTGTSDILVSVCKNCGLLRPGYISIFGASSNCVICEDREIGTKWVSKEEGEFMNLMSEQKITEKIGRATNVIIEYCKWYQEKYPDKKIFEIGQYFSDVLEAEYQIARTTYIGSSRTKDDLIKYASHLKLALDVNKITYMMDNDEYPRYADASFFN